jgi:hypothetical protein
VKEVIKSVLKDILEIGKICSQKQNLYYSLLCNTHCDGCGQYNLVSLRGYVRKYCNKTCWYTYDDDTVLKSEKMESIKNINIFYMTSKKLIIPRSLFLNTINHIMIIIVQSVKFGR